jgi:hypothetical protein
MTANNATGDERESAPPSVPESGVKTREELELRRQELDIQRAKLFIDFAKFGFAGTLTAAIVGMSLIFGLAVLSGLTSFKLDPWVLIVMVASIVVAAVAFGYLSLWELPKIAARIQKIDLSVGGEKTAGRRSAHD